MDFVQVKSSYSVQTDRNDYRAGYEVFDSSKMKYMAKILGNVSKPAAHMHVSCSAIQFELWYRALSSEERRVSKY